MSRRQRRARVQTLHLKAVSAKVLRRRARKVVGKPVAAVAAAALTMTGLGTSTVAAAGLRTFPSAPSDFVNVAGTLFFTADDGEHGRELWRSDGTRAGTVLVRDIRPGANPSDPSSLTVVGDRLFFVAAGGRRGNGLWRSDGTSAGTVLVKDVEPTPNGLGFASLLGVGRRLFFTLDDGTHGRELWKSDGTRTGTVLVKDINPGSSGSINDYPSSFEKVGETLFFAAHDGTHGSELWKSDGTRTGTVQVKDINPGSSPSINPYTPVLANVGGTLFFTADDATHGEELWKSDGTRAGTVLVDDIRTGECATGHYYYEPCSSYSTDLTAVGRTLFFVAVDDTHGRELWRSDGTDAGTVLVKDIIPGSGSSTLNSLAGAGGTLFFGADDGTRGTELWKSDGTSTGTVLVKDIQPGASGSRPSSLVGVGGRLFLVAGDGTHGRELWRSDGTPAGTVQVKDIKPGARASTPSSLTNVGRRLFFAANDGRHGRELWRSNGTTAGTVQVKDINATAT